MKIPILTDTHFGIRGDNHIFFDYFMKFYDNVFFPYIEENNITTVIHAGDFLDRRKYVNFNTLNRIRKEFLFVLFDKYDIKMHCILGNHDTYFKNTNEVNSMKEVFEAQYPDNFILYEKPIVKTFGDMDIALLPWISQENEQESLDFIKSAPADWVIAHLELKNFEVLRGVNHPFGMTHKIFERYEQVLSGHFHCRSEKDNVKYLGSPYQMFYSDAGDTKGFWVLDTEDRSLEFIENPYQMFFSIKYDDTKSDYSDVLENVNQYKDKFVKIYVAEKEKPEILDKIMDSLYNVGVYNLTIIENHENIIDDKSTTGSELDKSTIDLLVEEIGSNDKIKNQERIQKLVKELYLEALRT
tara:strand:- start:376 stop:1440 length:1065 start_codon:yes stop_codon:yes gene_type:complete